VRGGGRMGFGCSAFCSAFCGVRGLFLSSRAGSVDRVCVLREGDAQGVTCCSFGMREWVRSSTRVVRVRGRRCSGV